MGYGTDSTSAYTLSPPRAETEGDTCTEAAPLGPRPGNRGRIGLSQNETYRPRAPSDAPGMSHPTHLRVRRWPT